jgi:hypothetical protein
VKHYFFLVFLVLSFGTTTYLQACSCDLPLGKSEKERVKKAKVTSDAIFVGKLVRLVEPKKDDGSFTGEVIAEFEVKRAWKGITSSRVTIYTTNICCICGYEFSEGATYIVFAYGKEKLSTSRCMRTTPIAEEGISNDEKYLGKPQVIRDDKKSLGSTSRKN